MIPLHSSLAKQEYAFSICKERLEQLGFTLGGNWDYMHGCFDRALDREQQVWLRLPFSVTTGELDAEREALDTQIQFATPYILNHVYNEGLDEEAIPMTYRAFVDQFQAPVDPDAKVDPQWNEPAAKALREAEQTLEGSA